MRWLAAFVAGSLGVLAFAPFGWILASFVSLGGLVYLLERTPGARSGFAPGFVWGLGYFVAGVSWLYVALERYGGMPPPLAAAAILLFCAYLALYPALAGACYLRWRRGGPYARAAWFAVLWFLSEWLRGWIFTGFPWLAAGYAHTPPSPLAGYISLIGVYGTGAVVALLAALLVLVLMRWREVRAKNAAVLALVLCGVLGLSWAGRQSRVEPEGEALKISLVQTNIEQALKWNPAHYREVLTTALELVHAAQGDVVVLPESALPALVDRLPGGYLEQLSAPVVARGGALVTGVFVSDAEARIYNAAVSVGAGARQHYAKRHLVPFGEYSPPFFGWFYQLAHIPMSDQSRGAAAQPPLDLLGRQIALNICYEDVFGDELIDRLPAAGLMLNLSNLAWYGDSFAQAQHLQIAQVRAMESGRPMLRSTNTGMTALVLPDGTVAASLPAFTRGVLEVAVPAYRGLTPYARWGDWPMLVLAWVGVAGVLLSRKIMRGH
ncbi:apolipoprotein N-acyltransferase [Betaproteobacteria bacterium]|nr:apolipoprotein N-acyltransferase [Betaproteobacteria bacterium]